MAGYAVETDALRVCDAQLAAGVERSRTAVRQAHALAQDVLGAAWQGAAASAFRGAWHEWFAAASLMSDALDELAAAVGSSAAGYNCADAGVRAGVLRTPG